MISTYFLFRPKFTATGVSTVIQVLCMILKMNISATFVVAYIQANQPPIFSSTKHTLYVRHICCSCLLCSSRGKATSLELCHSHLFSFDLISTFYKSLMQDVFLFFGVFHQSQFHSGDGGFPNVSTSIWNRILLFHLAGDF